jgi:hypothetical protein
MLSHLLEIFDESNLDREWLVRNILGGLAAGFGLRGTSLRTTRYIVSSLIFNSVVLHSNPLLTTLIVLFGWAVKAFIATFVQPYLQDIDQERAWLMYSIP